MSLIPPKRLFNVLSMKTEMYKDVVDDVKKYGYVAVSHVWGNQRMYTVSQFGISGVSWMIPLSDSNKIHRLRRAMIKHRKKYCWFDVLCMPQNKQDEINLEIPFMGDYYAGAEMTLVLSGADYNIPKDYKRWLEITSDAIKSNRGFTAKEVSWFQSHDFVPNILEDVWFDRVWTFQEAVMSKSIIFVSYNQVYINLSDMLDVAAHSLSKNMANGVFRKDPRILLDLCKAIISYKDGKCNLASVMSARNTRECYKKQDKFYGVLGILGYKDFIADYSISVEDLNKKVVQYAYSKGDISWMAICRENVGFIQPMDKWTLLIGDRWKEQTPGICGIKIEDETITMNVAPFASINDLSPILGMGDETVRNIGAKIKEWNIKPSTAIHAVVGFGEFSDVYLEIGKLMLGLTSKNLHESCKKAAPLIESNIERANEFMTKIWSTTLCIGLKCATAKATVNKTGDTIMLVISGDPNVGDRAVLTKMEDSLGRVLGIIVSKRNENKGIFLYKKTDIPNHLYTPHKFLL